MWFPHIYYYEYHQQEPVLIDVYKVHVVQVQDWPELYRKCVITRS